MKLTKLSPAPGKLEAPSSALQRFALVRIASQLIPGVRRTVAGAMQDGRLLMARNVAAVWFSCIPLIWPVTGALAEQIPVANAKQLSHVRGYWPDSLSVEEEGHELSPDALTAAISTRLRDANLLTLRGPDAVRLHATVVVMPEHGGR